MKRSDSDHDRKIKRSQIVAVGGCVMRKAVEEVFLEYIKPDGCSWLSSC